MPAEHTITTASCPLLIGHPQPPFGIGWLISQHTPRAAQNVGMKAFEASIDLMAVSSFDMH